MRWKQLAWTALLVLLAALVLDWRSTRRMQPVTEAINRLSLVLEHLEEHMPDQGELYASWWYLDNGVAKLKAVTTKRNTGESVADWESRHDAAVASARALFPPI